MIRLYLYRKLFSLLCNQMFPSKSFFVNLSHKWKYRRIGMRLRRYVAGLSWKLSKKIVILENNEMPTHTAAEKAKNTKKRASLSKKPAVRKQAKKSKK